MIVRPSSVILDSERLTLTVVRHDNLRDLTLTRRLVLLCYVGTELRLIIGVRLLKHKRVDVSGISQSSPEIEGKRQ